MLILFTGCASTPDYSNNINKETAIIKYPVVMVHGIAAHDRKSLINFWGRIPETLRNNRAVVFLGNTDAWGSIESNAAILKSTIDKVLLETKSEKVNIIAHSKGGIDSRYLIWKYDYGDKIASLTTISTPHHGAELADLLFSGKIIHTNIAKKALITFGKLYGDTNPDIYNSIYQLTTENMREFNSKIEMDSRVYYQSIYTTMKNRFDDLMFFNSYIYVNKISGANDGIVSVASTRWSGNISEIEGLSHAEIVDFKMRNISGINIPDIYLNIIRDLGNRGF